MTGFPIALRFQVVLFPGTHVGRAALNRSNQIRDEIKAQGRVMALRPCGDETSASDLRFREMGFPRLGFQFPGQVVGDAKNQCLHGRIRITRSGLAQYRIRVLWLGSPHPPAAPDRHSRLRNWRESMSSSLPDLYETEPLRPLPENVSDDVIAKANAKDEALRAAK